MLKLETVPALPFEAQNSKLKIIQISADLEKYLSGRPGNGSQVPSIFDQFSISQYLIKTN